MLQIHITDEDRIVLDPHLFDFQTPHRQDLDAAAYNTKRRDLEQALIDFYALQVTSIKSSQILLLPVLEDVVPRLMQSFYSVDLEIFLATCKSTATSSVSSKFIDYSNRPSQARSTIRFNAFLELLHICMWSTNQLCVY